MDLIYKPAIYAMGIYGGIALLLYMYHSETNWELFGWGTIACLFYIFLILLHEVLVTRSKENETKK